jgi:predicted Zn-dependent protease with MMP-like domain
MKNVWIVKEFQYNESIIDDCGNVEGRFEIIGIYDSEEQAENVAGQFPNKSNIVRVCLNTLYDGGI